MLRDVRENLIRKSISMKVNDEMVLCKKWDVVFRFLQIFGVLTGLFLLWQAAVEMRDFYKIESASLRVTGKVHQLQKSAPAAKSAPIFPYQAEVCYSYQEIIRCVHRNITKEKYYSLRVGSNMDVWIAVDEPTVARLGDAEAAGIIWYLFQAGLGVFLILLFAMLMRFWRFFCSTILKKENLIS